MRTSSLPSPPPHPAPLLMCSSSLSGCAELDLSVTLSPTPNTGHSEMKLSPPGLTRGKKKEQVTILSFSPYIALFRHELQVYSGELAMEFTRSLLFTHAQRSGRFSAQIRLQQ